MTRCMQERSGSGRGRDEGRRGVFHNRGDVAEDRWTVTGTLHTDRWWRRCPLNVLFALVTTRHSARVDHERTSSIGNH